MNKHRRNSFGVVLAPLFALAGCGVPEEADNTPVESREQSIINGTPISAENSGFVKISADGTCSGTLLANDWVLSAKHCFRSDHVSNPATVTVTMGTQSTMGSGVWLHDSVDAAIVKLRAPLRMNSNTNGYLRKLYSSSNASLVGKNLYCTGYGLNTYTSGLGTLRSASLQVSSAGSTEYKLLPNGSGQIQWKGDSGGSCSLADRVTGVMSWVEHDAANQKVLSAYQVGAAAIRDWADWVIHGFGVGYKAHDYFCVDGEDCQVGDINGDGKSDVVTFIKNSQSGTGFGDVWVAQSNGNTFGAHYKAHDYFCVNGEECRVADISGDGKADLITFIKNTQGGTGFGDVWVALSDGSGFGGGYKAHDYFCVNGEECRVADVNGDGRADLITFIKNTQGGTGFGDVWVALSNGSGFGPAYKAHDFFCINGEECRVADVNGDRKADLITFIKNTQSGDGNGDVWVALSYGTTFGPGFKSQDYFCVGGEDCHTGDIDGDRRSDIITFIKNTKLGAEIGDVFVAKSFSVR